MDQITNNFQFYERLKIEKATAGSSPQISFLNDFQGALAFLRSMPPNSPLRQDIDFILALDSCSHARSFQKDIDHLIAHELATGQLVIVNRYHNPGSFHNFKRRPKEVFDSAPPALPPEPPKRDYTWVEIELVDAGGKAVPNERYIIKLPSGRNVEGTTDSRGRAIVERIVKPGNCKISFPDLENEDWMAA